LRRTKLAGRLVRGYRHRQLAGLNECGCQTQKLADLIGCGCQIQLLLADHFCFGRQCRRRLDLVGSLFEPPRGALNRWTISFRCFQLLGDVASAAGDSQHGSLWQFSNRR